MSDQPTSGEEQRRKMKEQFKKDLKDRKEFLNKVKTLRHQQRINKALTDMVPQDDTDDWVNRLNEETAFSAAKQEIAFETAKEAQEQMQTEAEMQKLVAESLVEQMKKEMAEEAALAQASTGDGEAAPEAEAGEEEQANNAGRKTLGDLDL